MNMRKAPVVLIAFNRPDMFRRVMNGVLSADDVADRDMFVFIDGPRNEPERAKCAEVCRVAESFRGQLHNLTVVARDSNLGCRRNIVESITQVSKTYGRVIVVEDDILVSRTFFTYMDEALGMYEGDQRIWCVNGFRNLGLKIPRDIEADVYLDARNWSWGWGTWYDRWSKVDFDMKEWPRIAADPQLRAKIDSCGRELLYMAERQASGGLNTWDIQCTVHMILNGLYAIEPKVLLSKSMGFGDDSTHCTGANPELATAPYYNIRPRLVAEIGPDHRILDQLRFATSDIRLMSRIVRKIKRIIASFKKVQDKPTDWRT